VDGASCVPWSLGICTHVCIEGFEIYQISRESGSYSFHCKRRIRGRTDHPYGHSQNDLPLELDLRLWGSRGGVYDIITLILELVWVVFSILSVLGIVNVVTGKAKELPVIGKFKFLKQEYLSIGYQIRFL